MSSETNLRRYAISAFIYSLVDMIMSVVMVQVTTNTSGHNEGRDVDTFYAVITSCTAVINLLASTNMLVCMSPDFWMDMKPKSVEAIVAFCVRVNIVYILTYVVVFSYAGYPEYIYLKSLWILFVGAIFIRALFMTVVLKLYTVYWNQYDLDREVEEVYIDV